MIKLLLESGYLSQVEASVILLMMRVQRRMDKGEFQMVDRFLGAMAIAAITAASTISITHYLLERPWCIQLDANGQQTIEYGQHDCIRRSRMGSNPSLYSTLTQGVSPQDPEL